MSDQYYPFYVGDYLRDTAVLTLVEHGAYHLLLHQYYVSNGNLTSDRQQLYRICRAFNQEEQRAIDTICDRYFTENGNNLLKNRKADEVLAKRNAFIAQQSEKGKRSAEKRWGTVTNVITTVKPMLQPDCNLPSPSPSPSPIPKKQQPTKQPLLLPEWVDRELWLDFLEHRKKLRKPMTRRAEEILLKKLTWLKDKGHNPKHLLMTSIERGWLSVFEPKENN